MSIACRYRYLGYEEEEIYEKLMAQNGIYCRPDPEGNLLSDEEIRSIAQSACRYEKGTPPPPGMLAALEVVEAYYRENPPKGMTEHTDKDIIEAFLEEALLHGSVVAEGIELRISYGSLADKAGVGDSTLRKAFNERLFESGRFKRSENPKGRKAGILILVISKFYATSAHSTTYWTNAPRLHKTSIDDLRSRWGKQRFGKARNHLLKRIEEAVELIEGEITPKKITGFLNQGVTDQKRLIRSTSISRHLAKMCEAGVLERIRHGVYSLKEERYRNLGEHMQKSKEFDSIYNQRVNQLKRQKEYSEFLGIEEGGLGDEIDQSPEMVEEIMEWNREKDWEEVEPYVLANQLGITVSEARQLIWERRKRG